MNRLLLGLLAILVSCSLFAQEEEEIPDGWTKGAGLGLDLSQLLQINPKQGAGQNRLGFGGAFNGFANMKESTKTWDNTALWQFGMERLGSGIIAQGATEKIPFQKAIDELRFSSKYGIQVKEGSDFSYAADFNFLSQLLPTYQFPDVYPGNFASDFIDSGVAPLSKLFSPATINFSVGINYKPNENFSLFFSPIGSKFIIVADEEIAARGVHGNPVEGERGADGLFTDFQKVDAQLGAFLNPQYTQAFAGEKGNFTSNLKLYSNYLNNPQNIDVDWVNSLAYELFKNFQLTMLLNVFYDDDVLVQITDNDAPNGVAGLGKRVSLTQQLLFTYTRTF